MLASASHLGLYPEDVEVEVAIAGGDWGRAAQALPPQDEDDLLAAVPWLAYVPVDGRIAGTAGVAQADWAAGGQADWGPAAAAAAAAAGDDDDEMTALLAMLGVGS